MSNYAIKFDLKNATGVDKSQFAKNANLANLKSEVDEFDVDKLKNIQSGFNNLKSKVDKLNVDKLAPVPTDLGKLSDVVKNEFVKKDVYDQLVKKVNAVDTSGFV